MAREFCPDLLCLQHCDLIWPDTILKIKAMLPNCRVVVVHYDSVFSPAGAERLRRFLGAADFAFATTAGSTLSLFAESCPVAFIPNPIDRSIDQTSAYSVPLKDADVFFAGGGAGARWQLIGELRREQPSLRYALYGRD